LERSAQQQPFVVPPGAGERTWSLNNLVTLKASAGETSGALGVLEVLVDKNGEPPPHVHHGEDESFYVLDGHVTMYVGDQVLDAPTGSFVFAPRDIPHRFTVDSGEAKLLLVITPGGFEGIFFEVGEVATTSTIPPPAPPDIARIVQAAAARDCEILPPPPG
jgi:quercetin dioxygenase-like cupin family protein